MDNSKIHSLSLSTMCNKIRKIEENKSSCTCCENGNIKESHQLDLLKMSLVRETPILNGNSELDDDSPVRISLKLENNLENESQSQSSLSSDVNFSDMLVEDIESCDSNMESEISSSVDIEDKPLSPIAPLILSLTPLINLKPPRVKSKRLDKFQDWGFGLSNDYLNILQEFGMLNYFNLVQGSLQQIFSDSTLNRKGPPRRLLGGEVHRDETWDVLEWNDSSSELTSSYSTLRDIGGYSLGDFFLESIEEVDYELKSFSVPASCPMQIPERASEEGYQNGDLNFYQVCYI